MISRDIIVIGASAGGLQALRSLVGALPPRFDAAVFAVLHIGPHSPGYLPQLLAMAGPLPACHPYNGQRIEKGRVYVAPSDHHMRLTHDAIRLDRSPKVKHTRPAADPLFQSAAEAFGPRVVGVVLTGGDADGSDGLAMITAHGGVGIVQDPDEAHAPSMPISALRTDHPDHCLPLAGIAPLLVALNKPGDVASSDPPENSPRHPAEPSRGHQRG
ncbi:MAG TPA: chemotaxis protein CheB [Azospirillum sp.]|nr:chemotaxis protein CheB [Azospirillum sp.]